MIDFYTLDQATPYRIAANGFDFSCLGESKRLVAGENLVALLELFRDQAPQLAIDDSYNSGAKGAGGGVARTATK